MQAAQAWAAFSAAILNQEIAEDYEKKFEALAASEQAAWERVAKLAPQAVPKK